MLYGTKLTRSTIGRWEAGLQNAEMQYVSILADFFTVSLDYINDGDADNLSIKPKAVKIPLIDTAQAGIQNEIIDDIVNWLEIPEDMANGGRFFALQIKGDSMAPRIVDGDIVIVRRQSDADSHSIVIAQIKGDDPCCRKLVKNSNGFFTLIPLNASYEPMYFSKKDIQSLPVIIIGKVVELRAKFI